MEHRAPRQTCVKIFSHIRVGHRSFGGRSWRWSQWTDLVSRWFASSQQPLRKKTYTKTNTNTNINTKSKAKTKDKDNQWPPLNVLWCKGRWRSSPEQSHLPQWRGNWRKYTVSSINQVFTCLLAGKPPGQWIVHRREQSLQKSWKMLLLFNQHS